MSRLSVAGTDETGDTVKVGPEHTNKTHEACKNTYINYNRAKKHRYADYSMYSTFLTDSSGSVLFIRSNLLKRKDLCFSCLRIGLIRHHRSLRSSHLFLKWMPRFCRVTTRETDILVNISIGIQIVLFPRTVFCDWFSEQREFLSVSLSQQSHKWRVLSCSVDYNMYSSFLTASPGSVLFSRSNLLKRKDLCFSWLRLGLIRHRRSKRSSHIFSKWLTRFCRVTT